jgi:hypothetical protein
MRQLALAALLAAAPAAAAPPDDFAAWISGDWIDPRVHRCDTVWVRIAAEAARIRVWTVTFGTPVLATESRLIGLGDGDGRARFWNADFAREQQIRHVTEDAHVLESRDGSGGVTFVRCPQG